METINWDQMLEGKYLTFANGVPKTLVLARWRPQEKFKSNNGDFKAGVSFDVLAEDDETYEGESVKEWTVTAIKALAKLRPVVEKAEAESRSTIKVRIVRIGEGKLTQYDIAEVEHDAMVK